MIQSMTGYGRTVVAYLGKKINVEIKSLNSKQLDLTTRIAPLYREKEMEIRQLIAERVLRGKVDFCIWIEKDAVTDAAQVINNHFIALSQRDRQMLRNTVADVVTSYIGMSNVTPADIEKYMNSLHADGSQDIKYVIRHLIVNKETDGSTPCYKVHFTVTQITRQGDKTGEHTFAGLSEINNEGKITSLILSQQS